MTMASPTETTNGKVKSRKRLIPLLHTLLNNDSIPQLYWLNKETKTWQMPWRHHKQTKWGDPDAFMLREMAKRLHGYDGPDNPAQENLKQWKELLRNALRSLKKDVQELKDMRVTDGDKPHKVYKFLNSEPEAFKQERSRSAAMEPVRDAEVGHQIRHGTSHGHRIFPESSPVFNAYSVFNGYSTNYQFPQTSNTAPERAYDVGKFDAGESFSQFSADPSQYVDFQTASDPVNRWPQVSPFTTDNCPDNYDNSFLDELVSELKLYDLTSLPSINLAYRSRSPIKHDNEEDSHRHRSQVDVNGPVDRNNGRVSNTTISTFPKLANILNDLATPNGVNQSIIRTDACPRSQCQNPTSNNIPNFIKLDQMESDNIPSKRSHEASQMKYAVNPGVYIANSTVGSCIEAIPIEASSNNHTNHAFSGISFPAEKSMLSSFPLTYGNGQNLTRVLQSAPKESLAVVVYHYVDHLVKYEIMNNTFRICFVPDSEIRQLIQNCTDQQQFGPTDVGMFELPIVADLPDKQARGIQKVLKNLTRGIIIDYRNGDIYATRYCKAVPHFCIPGETEFKKMERFQEVKIFDFNSNLKRVFDPETRYQNMKPRVRLTFAMKDPNVKDSALTVDIWHTEAYQMNLRLAENCPSLETDCSISDEYDNRLDQYLLLQKAQLNLYTTCLPLDNI